LEEKQEKSVFAERISMYVDGLDKSERDGMKLNFEH